MRFVASHLEMFKWDFLAFATVTTLGCVVAQTYVIPHFQQRNEAFFKQFAGTNPTKNVTEERVREIVREETSPRFDRLEEMIGSIQLQLSSSPKRTTTFPTKGSRQPLP